METVNTMTQNCFLIADLLQKDSEIVSSRTGKVLKCYHKMHKYLGDTIIDVEYCMWDATKKKSRSYKGREIKAMINGVWSIKNL